MTRRTRGVVTVRLTNGALLVGVLILGSCWQMTLAVPAAADEFASPALKTRLVSISLFKNGLGFMGREGALPGGQSTVLIEDLPAPALGTFWVYALGNEAAVRDLVAFEAEKVERVEAISVDEILQANVGQTLELRLSDKETIRARVISAFASRPSGVSAFDPARSPYAPYLPPTEPSSLLLLQTGSGTMALNRGSIQQLSSVNAPLKTTIECRKRSVGMRLNSTNPGGKGRLEIQYLAKGITWVPSCAIDITDAKMARVTTKAEIIDDIEDLDDVAVNLVTGFPNLKFADVTDPMVLGGDLAAFLNNLTSPGQAGNFRGDRDAMLRQSVMVNGMLADQEAFPTYSTAPQEGQTREELFFYEQKGVTLRKGERGYYPLFTTEAPYLHLYEWNIGDALDEQEQYRIPGGGGAEKAEDVWHSIRLTNTGSVPWTTSPAMTMQGGQILGQDLINYTSPGGKTTVRITKAVDIKAERAEFEIERTRNAANFYGYNYDLVEVKGQLKATNFKDKSITLTITKELSGEVTKTLPVAKVEQTARGLKKVNPKSVLTWEVPIKPREKAEIEYTYKVYVRD